MQITSFQGLQSEVANLPAITVAVAGAEDAEVLSSVEQGMRSGLVKGAILVGDQEAIARELEVSGLERRYVSIRHATSPAESAAFAVAAVNEGSADILVKGTVDSASYFKAILHKEEGLRASELLSNITVFELPSYHKLLAITDNAILLQPNLHQKQAIIENTRPLFRALNIDLAKVGAVAAIEKENLKMSATTDAAWLRKMNQAGKMPGFIVDGPFGYDACISRESACRKGLENSPVAGDPDLLLMPNLESANVLGKAYKYHANADSGGLVLGARVPVVLNSRSDCAQRRFNSLLLAKAVSQAAG